MAAHGYDDFRRIDPDQWRYAAITVAAWALVFLASFLLL